MKNTFHADMTSSWFVRFLVFLGSSTPLDPEERRKRISAVLILLIMICSTFVFLFYHLSQGHYPIVAMDGVGFVLASILLLYLRRQEKAPVVYWLIGVITVIFCSITSVLGRAEISFSYWAFVLPAICFSILGNKQGLAFCMIFFLLNLFLMTAPENLFSSQPYSSYVIARSAIIYLILTFIFYYYESSQRMLIRYIQQEKDKFENASKHDALTGLSNRRDIIERVDDEQKRYLRKGKPFTLIMGDIDHFKQINDNFGHDGGDYVLKTIAHLFKDQVRGIDCPSRWGGEEFLIMLVDTHLEGGEKVAERIRKKIESTAFEYKNANIPVTMTFGLSMYQGSDDHIEDCIKRADNALYEGKNQGRNRVVTA